MTGLTPEEDIPGDFTSQISGKLQSPVATGSFGEIYRCSIASNEGKTEVAVKVFKIDRGRTIEKLQKAILQELDVWLRLKHSTIVPLLGTARVESPLLALVSQWMPSGTLAEYLDEQAMIITPSARIGLVGGIADGLNYLHSENVVHGDLHPANVLIDGSGNQCLGDFGLATVAENPELQWNTTTVGRTFDSRWRAPEVLGIDVDPEKPTFKSDIYSFGSVMFFIISGSIPWKENKHPVRICIELSKRTTPARPHNIFDNQWDLIQQCWSWEPEHRPAATIVWERAEALMRQYETVYPLTITPEGDAYEYNQPSLVSASESLQDLNIHHLSHSLITGASGGSQPAHTGNDIIIDEDGSVAHNEVIHRSSTDFSLLLQPSALQHLQGQLPGQESGFLSQRSVKVTNTLPEEIYPPPEQSVLDFLPFGISYPVSYEPSALLSHSSVDQYNTYDEERALFGPSTNHHQEPHLLTRHMTEIHLQKVTYTCYHCGKAFGRRYMKKNHICSGRQCRGALRPENYRLELQLSS